MSLHSRIVKIEAINHELEKAAYFRFSDMLTPEERGRWSKSAFLKSDELAAYNASRTPQEVAADWELEIKFLQALQETFGYIPRIVVDSLTVTEKELGLPGPGPGEGDSPHQRLARIVAHLKELANNDETE